MSVRDYLPSIELEPMQTAESTVVWLHGLGANGDDFMPVAQMLQPALSRPTRFVLPHAPGIPVTINGGMTMPAWYDMYDMNHPRNVDWKTVKQSENSVLELLEREIERGISPQYLFLAGFSQGGVITLRIVLSGNIKFGGALPLSTYLLSKPGEEASITDPFKTRIFMAHGSQDSVIPLDIAKASKRALDNAGFDLEWHEYPMPHSVCEDEIGHILAWLNRLQK